jgi:RHS repeat-associated protein
VLRDRDTNADATLDERLYALQDPNWNVTAICESDGDVAERYSYTAYGTPTTLDDQYAQLTSPASDWETLFTGQRCDIDAGLYLYRMRYYHRLLGVWLTRDLLAPYGAENVNSVRVFANGGISRTLSLPRLLEP